jgi:LAO/AO transport system kinase
VDSFLLLLQPGSGDELQGIKRGIVEMADLLVVTKADGTMAEIAKTTQKEYKNAIHLFSRKSNNWQPEVLMCSSFENGGFDQIWQKISSFKSIMQENGWWEENRRNQMKVWFREVLKEDLLNIFQGNEKIKKDCERLENEIAQGLKPPFRASKEILRDFFKT